VAIFGEFKVLELAVDPASSVTQVWVLSLEERHHVLLEHGLNHVDKGRVTKDNFVEATKGVEESLHDSPVRVGTRLHTLAVSDHVLNGVLKEGNQIDWHNLLALFVLNVADSGKQIDGCVTGHEQRLKEVELRADELKGVVVKLANFLVVHEHKGDDDFVKDVVNILGEFVFYGRHVQDLVDKFDVKVECLGSDKVGLLLHHEVQVRLHKAISISFEEELAILVFWAVFLDVFEVAVFGEDTEGGDGCLSLELPPGVLVSLGDFFDVLCMGLKLGRHGKVEDLLEEQEPWSKLLIIFLEERANLQLV
jgi:hypothetical protein